MNKKLQNAIVILFIIILSIIFSEKVISQNDTFYLIKLGDYISHNGIDLLDHYSWIGGLSYTYPHWMYSILLYFVYNNFGFDGIYVFNIITYIALIVSIYYINLKINGDRFTALFISLISFPLLKIFVTPRAQTMSCILFVWEVYYIIQLVKTGSKKYIIYLVIDSFLIANIHGTIWLMYFVFFMPFIISQIIYQFFHKNKIKFQFTDKIIIDKINNIKLLLIAFVFSFLVGLLTPSRICYTYFFKISLGESQQIILEHLPLSIIRTPFLIGSLFLLYFSSEKIKLHEFFMLCGLFLMSFIGVRYLIFFYTIGLLYLSIILTRNISAKNDKTFQILYNKIFNSKITICFILSTLIITCIMCFNNNVKVNYIDENEYPVYAVKYIKENLDYKNIKIYNNYDDGSYLLFNDIKVFVDSRCDLYLKEFNNNKDILNDFILVNYDYKYEKIFNKYGIQYALIRKKDALNYILMNDTNYKNIYMDDNYVIYKKNEGCNNAKKI